MECLDFGVVALRGTFVRISLEQLLRQRKSLQTGIQGVRYFVQLLSLTSEFKDPPLLIIAAPSALDMSRPCTKARAAAVAALPLRPLLLLPFYALSHCVLEEILSNYLGAGA